jgi:hypothetical protein
MIKKSPAEMYIQTPRYSILYYCWMDGSNRYGTASKDRFDESPPPPLLTRKTEKVTMTKKANLIGLHITYII